MSRLWRVPLLAAVIVARASLPAAAEDPAAAAWHRLAPAPDLPADRALVAGFLLVEGIYDTELMAPWDVLEHTSAHLPDRPGIEVITVAANRQPVRTAEGLLLMPDADFASAPPLDILVVASAEHSRDRDLDDDAMIGWLRRVGGSARYVVSLCWGAFVLAQAGLLDGRAATTFPSSWEELARRFPAVRVARGVGFVHDGKVLTSEGGVKSYDVAMYLVDHLFGEQVAQAIGGGLLIPWPPEPGRLTPLVVAPREQR